MTCALHDERKVPGIGNSMSVSKLSGSVGGNTTTGRMTSNEGE